MTRQKIAILNFVGCSNYGANLTAYALKEACEKLGHQADHIDQRHLFVEERNQDVFYRFADKYLSWTKPIYGFESCKTLNADYDTFIVGSDQVWLYSAIHNLLQYPGMYFLSFANGDKRRISVAASFGRDSYNEVPEDYRRNASDYLSQFTAISVREASGVDICKQYLHSEAEHILDPVFFLDSEHWEKMADQSQKKLPERYVAYGNLCRRLEPAVPALDQLLQSKSLDSSEAVSGEVVDFLATIKNAQFVVTDSFHVLCFALIYKKNFICLNPASNSGRMPGLLDALGLSDRIIEGDSARDNPQITVDAVEKFLNKTIDYDRIATLLSEPIARSLSFLENALAAKQPESAEEHTADMQIVAQERKSARKRFPKALAVTLAKCGVRALQSVKKPMYRKEACQYARSACNILCSYFSRFK